MDFKVLIVKMMYFFSVNPMVTFNVLTNAYFNCHPQTNIGTQVSVSGLSFEKNVKKIVSTCYYCRLWVNKSTWLAWTVYKYCY